MVASAGGYYGAAFKGFQGLTQGDPLSLTIFNMVANSVVCHCISLVSVCTRGQYGWGMEVLHCTDFLYAGDGLVASMDPVWFQGEFDTMTRLFDGDGIWTNIGKTFIIICHPCCTVGTHWELSYERRMNG